MKTFLPESDMEKPTGRGNLLKNLRVLDLADHRGSFCSRLLADLGAQVIKVERPGGDPDRREEDRGERCGGEMSPAFLYHNRNKLGVTLDLERKEGRRLFLRLVKSQDVVVHTFFPGYLERLGLGYDRLKIERSDLILAALSGYGNSGPKQFYKSCDLVAAACGGHMAVTGRPGGAPLRLYGNQTYYAACLFGACAILLALHRKNRTGEGEHLNISLQEAATATLEHVMVRYFSENIVPKREGGAHWDNLFHMLPCKDGYIQMTVFEDWDTLLELMDRDAAAADLTEARWEDASYRLLHKDHVLEVLGRWTRRFTRKELFELGQCMRFPWGSVQRPDEILSCSHLWDRGFFSKEAGESDGDLFLGLPFRLSGSEGRRKRGAPTVGEHNHLIYGGEVGLDDGEVERLTTMGII